MENQNQKLARLRRKMYLSQKRQEQAHPQQGKSISHSMNNNITPPSCFNTGTSLIGSWNYSVVTSSIGRNSTTNSHTTISRTPLRDVSNCTTISRTPLRDVSNCTTISRTPLRDVSNLSMTPLSNTSRKEHRHYQNINVDDGVGSSKYAILREGTTTRESKRARTESKQLKPHLSVSITPISRYSFNSLKSGKHKIQRGSIIQSVAKNISHEFEGSRNDLEDNSTNNVHSRETGPLRKNDFPRINCEGCWDIGDPNWECEYCGAMMWYEERTKKDRKSKKPTFSLCCLNGTVELPLLKSPPRVLSELLMDKDARSRHFGENIRAYNMMYSFTSMGGKIDNSVNDGHGRYTFRLHGQNFHRIGNLLPPPGLSPKFSQLYIYDTENEESNRMKAVSSHPNKLDDNIVGDLKKMLDEHNSLAKSFRMAKDRFDSNEHLNVKLKLIGRRETDGRRYNLPSSDEVAALIIWDIDNSTEERDILLETQTGCLQRISELHPSYLALQYPLLFPYGEDGYRIDIEHRDIDKTSAKKRSKLSMREFFAFRIQERRNEAPTILLSKKLFQQFLVDGYTMIESERLSYIRFNQKKLRADCYKNLKEAAGRGNIDPSSIGTRIILPSSFTGGVRYMIQNYQDAMALCKWYGYPDLFITFTCNPKWPEITRFLKERGLKAEDRPDILCRVFKIKLNRFMKDIRKHKVFGRVQAVIYTVEFQKRGLPHAHILLFMHHDDKFPTAEEIDKVICAEIPDKKKGP